MQRATTLLIRGMRQADRPVEELCTALGRMAQTLNALGCPPFGRATAPPMAQLQSLHEALASDLAVCIQSLQFHDRLMQQLTLAHDLLVGHSANGLPARIPSESANEGSIVGSVELF